MKKYLLFFLLILSYSVFGQAPIYNPGSLNVEGSLKVGTGTNLGNGTIRYNNGAFEFFTNGQWVRYSTGASSTTSIPWDSITSKPITFTPSTHTHSYLQAVVAGANITVDNTNPLNPVISASGSGGGTADSSFVSVTTDELRMPLTSSAKTLWRNGTTNIFLAPTTTATYTGTNSTIVGVGAGYALTTAGSNTLLGYYAAAAATNGNEVTAIGAETFRNLTWRRNTGVGYRVYYNAAAVEGLVGMGYLAGTGSTTPSNSISIGNESGSYVNGAGNVFLGHFAHRLTSASTLSNTISIGAESGTSSTASNSVYIGYRVGQSNTTNYRLLIGSGNGTPLVDGSFFPTPQVTINGNLKSATVTASNEAVSLPAGSCNNIITGTYATPPSAISLDSPSVGSTYRIISGTSADHITIVNSGNWYLTADWTPNSIGDVLEIYIQASNRWVEIGRSDNR